MSLPVVNSFNEWDPLEEVIVGVLDGGAELPWEMTLRAVMPRENVEEVRRRHIENGGRPQSVEGRTAAQRELEEFVHILEAEGVVVRRPDPIDWAHPYCTPDWTSLGGNAQTCPRDILVTIGNEIIEAPMSWRSRYFEVYAYRRLLNEYFRGGAKWTAAPKPRMTDDLYEQDFSWGNQRYVTTEHEPVFDAADIARCGTDLFVQRSHATNRSGFEWLQRHLGEQYRLHLVEFDDELAIHIDATFVPLAPGKLMVNPDRPIKKMPDIVRNSNWEILVPPRSTLPSTWPLYRYLYWLSLNVLMLDQHRVIVEKNEAPLIETLKEWGFDPIPCAFRSCYEYGGSFHCFTSDIRRRGNIQSYF